jgi:ABC-type bacteriocin/lantibiotic exporter with double-glycine peptidase domain
LIMDRRHVPVILQMNAVECGAACMAMILSYHGRKTQVAECRASCGVGRDGLTAQAIAEDARNHGLRVKAFSLEPADLQRVRLPAIAHWEFNHFVVIERWSPNEVQIVDPALGRRRLTTDEFSEGSTGVVLTFEPALHFERRRAAGVPLWRDYLKGILRLPGIVSAMMQVLGASLLLQALGLAVPLLTKVLLDHVLPFEISNLMPMLGMAMIVMALAIAVTNYLRSALLIHLEARLDSTMMLGFFEHVLSLPFHFFQQRATGDLLMRLGSNTVIRETLTTTVVASILDAALVLGYLVMLLVFRPFFGTIVLGLALLQIALLVGTNRRMHDLTQRDLLAWAASQSYFVEALSGIATLKASGAEDRALDHWSNLFFRHLNVSLDRNQLSAVINTAMTTLRTFSPLALLWVGAVYVLHGRMTVGTMLALNAFSMAILTPVASLVSSGQQIQLVRAHLDRIADVLEAEPEQRPRTPETPPLSGRIELNHVSFRYDQNAPLVLRDIFLHIEPGQKVALVGRSGSGKSTLAKLLLGLYTPTQGEILYDGNLLECLNHKSVRRQTGAVLQESFLFTGSIRQNIAFNHPELDLEQVAAAARLADIHDEIMKMPMGYESVLAEGGSSLSGGQRQRLSLARAVAHKPAVLVLDEATSHLDVLAERRIDEHLADLTSTRIVIAHRLSTVRNADMIVVLEDGKIVERGSHTALLAKGGHYANLVRGQAENGTYASC